MTAVKDKERWWGISRKRWDDERVDDLGDRGPWEDQGTLSRTSRHDAGNTTQLERPDGSSTGYRYTGGGWRVIEGSVTPPTTDMNDPHRGTGQQNSTNWRGEAEYYRRQAAINRPENPAQADHDAKNASVAEKIAEVKEKYPDVPVGSDGSVANFKHAADTPEGLRERARTLRAVGEVAGVTDPLKELEFNNSAAQMERAAEQKEADASLAAASAEFEKAASAPPPASPPPLPVRQPNPPPALPPPPRQPAPTPPLTSPSSSGASMSGSIGDAAAGIRGACDIAGESTGMIGHAIEKLEEAKQRMMAAAEGTAQADVGEAMGLFERAIACCQEAQGGVSAAQTSATDVAGRL